jgi:hypothetical protein
MILFAVPTTIRRLGGLRARQSSYQPIWIIEANTGKPLGDKFGAEQKCAENIRKLHGAERC